jgi:hypothetical protein
MGSDGHARKPPSFISAERRRAFREASLHIDNGMLKEIAEADYGMMAAECYEVLLMMRDRGHLAIDDGDVREVLELIMLSEPDQADWKPSGVGLRGHWTRVFCCASLLRIAGTSGIDLYRNLDGVAARLFARLCDRPKPLGFHRIAFNSRSGHPSLAGKFQR